MTGSVRVRGSTLGLIGLGRVGMAVVIIEGRGGMITRIMAASHMFKKSSIMHILLIVSETGRFSVECMCQVKKGYGHIAGPSHDFSA